MNIKRKLSLIVTALPRAFHRQGFGVQSPSDYELVRDVLFEKLHYYAYEEQNLNSQLDRQMFRIKNRFRGMPIIIINTKSEDAKQQYLNALQSITPDTVMIMEHIDDENAALWSEAVKDSRTILTFDMRKRGLILFTAKRIKQNYNL
ncbi:MAG: hypothetical protein MJZ41_15560 [Bacteroidaceae bacterium]|nr:hypothetical protein [Bacteroidaceae bacterium]